MSQLQIEDLLNGLCREGEVDSSGQFTLDRSKALEKMRAFQLDNPYAYCLKWLQAAVAGGARSFAWESNPKWVRARIQHMNLNPELLGLLPSLLFDSRGSVAEKHLSAGLNAVIQTKAQSLSVSWSDGLHGVQAVWRSGRFEQATFLPPDPTPQVEVTMVRTPQDRLREWWYAANYHHIGEVRGGRQARDREQQLLHESSGFAPGHVSIQGVLSDFQLRATPTLLSQLRSLLTLRSAYGFRTATMVAAEKDGFYLDRISTIANGRRCRLFLATPHTPPDFTVLYLVRDGVTLEPQHILEGLPGKVVVACAQRLKTDLSGLRIVTDENWEALVEEVRQRLQKEEEPRV